MAENHCYTKINKAYRSLNKTLAKNLKILVVHHEQNLF